MHTGSTPPGQARSSNAKKAAKPRTRAKAADEKPTLHLKSQTLTKSTSDFTSMIATAAYYRAEQRNFEPGHELEDWLAAEEWVKATYS